MKSLVAALLILATPLCAQAEPRWHDRGGPGRYAPPPAQAGPRRGPYGPPPRQGPPPPYYAPPPQQAPYTNQGPPRTPQERAREAVRAGRRAPLPVVIERLRRQMGAEYLDTRETRDAYGRPIYVLRFRQRGRLIDVPVDAETGEVQR